MANRFWVGGTGNLDGTTSHWSTTTGGSSGASFPGTSDVAIFDANSGGGTITMTTDLNVSSFRFDGIGAGAFAGTFITNGHNILFAATSTFSAGMTLTMGANDLIENQASATLNTNGKTLGQVYCGAGTLTLGDDLTCRGMGYELTTGLTINTNGKSVSADFLQGTQTTGTLTLGASVVTITGTGANVLDYFDSMTITSNTSTLKFTGAAPQANLGGKTWNNIWCANGNGNKTIFVTNGGTMAGLKADAGVEIDFAHSKTYTVTSLTMAGVSGQLIKLRSDSAGSTYTISDTSGTNAVTLCDIKDCIASGGATFTCTGGVNSGNNTGWTFINFTGFARGPRLSYLRR